MIYVISAVGTGFVKIGISARGAGARKGRLESMQIGCPHELVLIAEAASWPDREEQRIHRYLETRGAHVRGEWFRLCEPTSRIITYIRNGGVGLIEWHEVCRTGNSRLSNALKLATA